MDIASELEQLLHSEEPSIRYKVRKGVLGEAEDSPGLEALCNEIKTSKRAQTLLADRDAAGRIRPADQPYKKWIGAHWVLAALADIGYPPGDEDLIPIVDQVLDFWLRPELLREWTCEDGSPAQLRRGVPILRGRARRCASQQANALWSTLMLGFLDDRSHQLARLLVRWQWPDGGWNCDRRPEACHSSFWESLLPLRALARYGRVMGDRDAGTAAEAAAELFLARRLFRRRHDGEIMNPQFLHLHYPCYWRYDILFGLKVMAESGFIDDARCQEALDLLEGKRLAGGGWPAQERFYSTSPKTPSGRERVSWAGVGRQHRNEWVTADALYVLKAAGRLDAIASESPAG